MKENKDQPPDNVVPFRRPPIFKSKEEVEQLGEILIGRKSKTGGVLLRLADYRLKLLNKKTSRGDV